MRARERSFASLRMTIDQELSQRFVQVPFDPVAEFGQIFFCHLQEMRGGAMSLEGGGVLILFVDKEPARICLVLMHLIHEAAVFFRPNSFTKLGPRIVCSRLGPVEIIPTRAPVSFSMKARYSRAALGNASTVRMACVELAQPGMLR